MQQSPFTHKKDTLATFVRAVISPRELIHLLVVMFLWLLTFWCIQLLQGQISTAFVVYGRVLATSVAGYLVLRKRRTPWEFLGDLSHYLVAGTIHAVVPLTLFLTIHTFVPKSNAVIMQMIVLLSFAMAVALTRHQPLRLRVLICGNLGIIACAWLMTKGTIASLELFVSLCMVVSINTLVVFAARWYTRLYLPDTSSLVFTTAAQCIALGWMIPLVSWYGTRIPTTLNQIILVGCIWLGAVAISFCYQQDQLRTVARYIASYAPFVPILFAYPWGQSNGRIVDTIVMLCVWGLSLILIASASHTPTLLNSSPTGSTPDDDIQRS